MSIKFSLHIKQFLKYYFWHCPGGPDLNTPLNRHLTHELRFFFWLIQQIPLIIYNENSNAFLHLYTQIIIFTKIGAYKCVSNFYIYGIVSKISCWYSQSQRFKFILCSRHFETLTARCLLNPNNFSVITTESSTVSHWRSLS